VVGRESSGTYDLPVSNYDLVLAYTEDYAAWLDERGYQRPAVREGNRLPAPAEILAVLRAVPDSELEVGDSYVFLSPQGSGPSGAYWLRLEAPARSSWKDESWEECGYFTVKAAYEEELPVVIALAATCGQLLIYPDTGAVPLILDGGDDPATILRLLAQADDEADEWQAFHRLRYG
jgi:hypothetical protein